MDESRFTADMVAARGCLAHILSNYFHNEADVDDAIQQTYLLAWRGRAEFRGECAVKTWLCWIAKNVAVGELRRLRFKAETPMLAVFDAPDERIDTEGDFERLETRTTLMAAVSKLRDNHRASLEHYLDVNRLEALGQKDRIRLLRARLALLKSLPVRKMAAAA
jgi:RNA polymerase sigma-70 factor (ECF subfamily)